MHDGKYGHHLEVMKDAQGRPTEVWVLSDYGSPDYIHHPTIALAMTRDKWRQLAQAIRAMDEGRPDPHPLERRQREPWVDRPGLVTEAEFAERRAVMQPPGEGTDA
jgi:hypothetical protein